MGTVLQFENENVIGARIVLSGVAPYPWRVIASGKLLIGTKLDNAIAEAAGQSAAEGANPERDNDNGYKVEMVQGAVEESILTFA